MNSDLIEQLRSCPIFKGSSFKDDQDLLDSSLMTYSLVSVYHDTVYLWHKNDRKLYSIGMKSCGRNDSPLDYKTLLVTSVPYSSIRNVEVCGSGSRLLLYGSRCITVVDLPAHCPLADAPPSGSTSGVDGGLTSSAVVTCVSHHVAERFLLCSSHVTVVKACWHPDSPADCHLVVLCSDNYLRVFHVSEDVQTPSHVVAVGPTQSAILGSSAVPLSFVGSMGGAAVAFDFGPAQAIDRCRPIYLLRGNGDVLSLQLNISKRGSSSHHLSPPLAMLPSVEDNYGTDACDLLCISSPSVSPQLVTPTMLIVATPDRVYHCVVLDQPADNADGPERFSQLAESPSVNYTDFSPRYSVSLHIYECVELKMSLLSSRTSSADQSQPFDLVAPVRLHRDPASDYRYYCTHLYGAHCVSVPLIPALQRYCKLDDESDEPLGEHPAQVAHLLCTDPAGSHSSLPSSTDASHSTNAAKSVWRPVLGLCIVTPSTASVGVALSQAPPTTLSQAPPTTLAQAPPLLLLLLHDHSPVVLPCERRFLLELENCQIAADMPVTNSDTSSSTKSSIESHVRRLLERCESQPHLHSSLIPPLPQQLQLLTSSSCRLRSEYIRRQRLATDWLQTSCSSLQQLYEQQVKEIKLVEARRKELRARAEQLAEQYHELLEKHETFKKRIDTISSLANLNAPTLSDAERHLMNNVSAIGNNVSQVLAPAVQQVLAKYNYQKDKTTTPTSIKSPRSSAALSSSQTRSVRQILAKEGHQIAELVKWVNAAKQVLSV